MSQKDRKAILFFSLVGGLVLSVLVLVIYSMTQEDVRGDEGFVTYEELRTYDHELQTKEGGIFDLWEDSKRQDEKIQNNWEYINDIDARLHKLENQLQGKKQKNPTQKEVIAMVSNEGGQAFLHNDGSITNKNEWMPGQPVVMNYWGGESREIPFDGCKVMHKTRPNREQSDAYRYANYTYQQGGRDMLLLWNAENGSRNPKQQSNVIFADGHREPSFGFCQLLKQPGYNADAISDPRFFSDPFRQLDRCTEKYEVVKNKGEVWYARPHREKRGVNLYLQCK